MTTRPPVTEQTLVTKWAEITIQRFQESIDRLKIGASGTLRSTIVKNIVTGSAGNVALVELKFKYYGRFVDMGVGRGVPIGGKGTEGYEQNRNSIGQLLTYNRTRKNWYATNKTREIHKLRELLVEELGINVIYNFESKLDGVDAKIEI